MPIRTGTEYLSLQKLQSQTSWKEFREAAARKAGLGPETAITFFWEGCQVQESDDRLLGQFARDGDTFVLVVTDIKSSAGGPSEAVNQQSAALSISDQQEPVVMIPPKAAVSSKRAFGTLNKNPSHKETLSKRQQREAEVMMPSLSTVEGLEGGQGLLPPLLTTNNCSNSTVPAAAAAAAAGTTSGGKSEGVMMIVIYLLSIKSLRAMMVVTPL